MLTSSMFVISALPIVRASNLSVCLDAHYLDGYGQPLHCHARPIANHLRSVLDDGLGTEMHTTHYAHDSIRKVGEGERVTTGKNEGDSFLAVESNVISIGLMSWSLTITDYSLFDAGENEKKINLSIGNFSSPIKKPTKKESSIRYKLKHGRITVYRTISLRLSNSS